MAQQYAATADAVRGALGDRVEVLEHVGSTSVSGLPAKPMIDVLLLVADPAGEASYVPDLEAAGSALRLREPGGHEHRLLRCADPVVNLHVFGAERMLLFRHRLRSYADAKSEVVEAVIARARDCAR